MLTSRFYFVIIFFSCLPYLFIGFQFPGQVQPMAGILSAVTLLLLIYSGNSLRLSGREILIVILSIFFICNLYEYTVEHLLYSLRKTAGFILGVPLYLIAKKIKLETLKNVLMTSSTLYILIALIQMASPSIYLLLGEFFFETRQVIIGDRGVSSIAPEATDFGFICSYFLFLCYMSFSVDGYSRRIMYALFLSLFGMILSGSASGFVSAFLWLIPIIICNKKNNRILLWFFIIVLGAIFLSYGLATDIRGLQILFMAITDPVLLLDTSFVHRFVHNLVSFFSLIETSGIGYGAGSFIYEAPSIYNSYGLAAFLDLNGHYTSAVSETLGNHALSVISQLLLEFGMVGIFYVYMVFSLVLKSNSYFKLPILILMALTWVQSFPSAFPLFWLVLGLSFNPNFQKKLHN